MRIDDHRLAGHAFRESPNRGEPIEPSFIVLHFTSTFGAAEAIKHLCDPATEVSAHIVLDVDGSITQLVPFNVMAWHAGRSRYVTAEREWSALNAHSIGIEIVNPGWFTRGADGTWLHEGRRPSDAAALARFPSLLEAPLEEGPSVWWTGYPAAQLDALERLVRALLENYPGLRHVVGHSDIAPGRKIDPGPAFPMARFRRLLPGASDMST